MIETNKESDIQEQNRPLFGLSYDVLVTLLSGPNHGYNICKIIQEALESTAPIRIEGNLYSLLRTLEKEGLISQLPKDESSRKKVYCLTEKGSERLKQSAEYYVLQAQKYSTAVLKLTQKPLPPKKT